MSPYSLEGRHALVCGASKGIGRAAAMALAELGASVTVLARSEEALQHLVPELRAAGAPVARPLVADMDDLDGFGAALDRLIAEHGPVHVAVHNTGGPPGGRLLDADSATILAPIHRHLLTAHALVQRTLPGMRAAGYGRFVLVTSISVREPLVGLGVSNITRGAMASWAKTLSRELPPGVTINNVLPGYTNTERLIGAAEGIAASTGQTPDEVRASWISGIPEGRIGRPEELGAVIAFLASPAASFVRGAAIPVDGGFLKTL